MPKGAKRWLEFCQYVVPDIVIIIRGHLLLNMRIDWARDDIGQKCNHNLPQGSLHWVLLCMICDNKIEWLYFEQYPYKLPSIFVVCWPLVRKERLLDQIETRKPIDIIATTLSITHFVVDQSVKNALWSVCLRPLFSSYLRQIGPWIVGVQNWKRSLEPKNCPKMIFKKSYLSVECRPKCRWFGRLLSNLLFLKVFGGPIRNWRGLRAMKLYSEMDKGTMNKH